MVGNWQTNTRSEQLVLRKRNSFENKSFHDNMFDYFVIDSKDEMTWKIKMKLKSPENIHYKKQRPILVEDLGKPGLIREFLFRKVRINFEDYQG